MKSEAIDVVVIDDDERVLRALQRLLRAAGFSPTGYSSAEDFLKNQTEQQADCLVLDIQLGGMSGLDLHKELTAQGKAPPIVFITAHDEPEIRKKTQEAGCAGFFHKPLPGSALLEAVRNAVSASRQRAE